MSPQGVLLSERYSLTSEIARGGMAVVWKARDEVLARTVAIKLLHPHLSDDEAFLERFRREALAAAKLTHPNVVAIYDTGNETTADGVNRHFIVMEYCSGGTLADIIRNEGPLEPVRVVSVASAICDALAYAHGGEIIHRDIKPANVLMTGDGSIKVADFGIAKAVAEVGDITTTGTILGTVSYISPEQARGEEPDARSDLYSLGVVLFELLTGRPPFAEETQLATAMKHVREPPPAPRSLKAGIPRALDAVVLRALEKDPAARFQSADELRDALQSAGGGGSTVAMRVPAPPRVPRQVRRDERAPAQRPPRSGQSLIPVLLFIALAVVAAVILSNTLRETPRESKEDDGNVGSAIDVASVTDFDPHGGDGEHPDQAALAADGDTNTSWTTENYSAPLELQGKPGVGLLFDLGDEVEVTTVEVITSDTGSSYELRATNEPGEDEMSFEVLGAAETAGPTEKFEVSRRARYWLVWITRLSSDGGGRASIAEVRFIAG